MVNAMKARLSVAAMLVLAGFALWQHVQMHRLSQELMQTQAQLREAAKHDVRVKNPLLDPSADPFASASAPVLTRRADGSIVEYGEDQSGQKPFRVRPMPAAPGSRRPQVEHYRNLISDPASTINKPKDRTPYGLYGR